ncbi:MAG: BatA and WFA domain-containing protein [Planctomycetota bacterium]
MTLAEPWTALTAACIGVPLLFVLYFLKLRRQRQMSSSTLLWKRAFEDLQVNAPFQRLRWSLLLFVQLMILAAIVLALGQPTLTSGAQPSTRMILLIDRSASMNVRTGDGETTRLDDAKEQARRLIEQLGRDSDARQMMVMTFASSPTVLCGYESNRGALRSVIDGIEPSDETANLTDALRAVSAFAQRAEGAANEPPDVVLISDGGVGDPRDGATYSLAAGEFRFVSVGGRENVVDNVGITACSVRRDYDDPALLIVFARLVQTGAAEREVSVRISINGETSALRRVTLAPATDEGPGEGTMSVPVEWPDGGVVSVRASVDDALPVDDTAWVVVPEPAGIRLALVHPQGESPDAFLEKLLTDLEPATLRRMAAPPDMTSVADAGLALDDIDLVIFDRVSTALPDQPSVMFGAMPIGVERGSVDAAQGQPVLSWERQHPLMRYVELDSLLFLGFGGMQLPATGVALAQSVDGPVIAELRTRGARHVVVGFALSQSNWPADVSLAVFLQNAIEYLTLTDELARGLVITPGESIAVRIDRDADEVRIASRADDTIPASAEEIGIDVTVPVSTDGGGSMVLPALPRAGLYDLTGSVPPYEQVAVSVLSEQESDARVRMTLPINASAQTALSAVDAGPRPLWPWAVGIAAVLAVLEWLLYCWRLRGPSRRATS